MPTSDDEIRTLERAAFEAWQAEEVSALGPWRLRAMRGVTKRANSVWAGPGEPPGGFTRAIAEAGAWYAARRLTPIFQIAPIADPRLDALLAERGYQGYYNNSVATDQTIDKEGWLHTGRSGDHG